jgi:hypothetical protein
LHSPAIGPAWLRFPFANMKTLALSALLCLLCATSCSRPASSGFLAAFIPGATLTKLGSSSGISYSNSSTGTSSSRGLFSGTRIRKHWSFSFQGSHAQLSDQLDRLRAEFEQQLSSSGATISGRGRWSGGFSGFSFDYTSSGMSGFLRVTGVSFESGTQGLEILAYEH